MKKGSDLECGLILLYMRKWLGQNWATASVYNKYEGQVQVHYKTKNINFAKRKSSVPLFNEFAFQSYNASISRQTQHDAVTMATDEEDENEAEARRSSSAELARCQECTGCLDMCFGLFLMLAYVVIEYMPQLLQKDRYKTFH